MSTVCGPSYTIPDSVCCTKDQLETLRDKTQQAAPLIASCPACHNNFRTFYCDFTCSPDQSTFLDIVSIQNTTSGKQAVKEVNYLVSDEFRQGFYDSCKSVQFGATNGFAMDLIGGGAKDANGFLKYMGDMRPGLGSPFQISFPEVKKTGGARVSIARQPVQHYPTSRHLLVPDVESAQYHA
jgi:Niemann-Pick C1 protein